MTALRKRLPGAVVIKHRDASFIGLPDCSVTYQGRVFWLEFKLWIPPKKWNGEDCKVLAIAEESPAQFDMMKRLEAAAPGQTRYIVWAKKRGQCFVWKPGWDAGYGGRVSQADLLDRVASLIRGVGL